MATTKKRPRPRAKKKLPADARRWRIMAVSLVAALIVTGVAIRNLLVGTYSIAESKRRVWVAEPESVAAFAADAQKRGLVRHRWLLELAARLQGFAGPVAPAGYRFATSTSAWDLAARLQRGGSDFTKLRLPEGLMAAQVPERLRQSGYPRAHEFAQIINAPLPHDLRPAWLPHGRVEGYLFPNTYFIDLDGEPRTVLMQMLGLFAQQVTDSLSEELTVAKRSLHAVVTLASLIEREVVKPSERSLVAGVYLNRLRLRQRLECDATVQYALGYWKKRILNEDLKVDSPYNTYRHSGLPPGPICNPGLACIEAALRPTPSAYLFYVADGNGGHVFSRTYAEHLANVARVRKTR